MLVHVRVLQLRRAQAGDHPQQAGQRSHAPDRLELLEEVVQPELVAAQLALELHCALLLQPSLGALDQAHHVAHAENPLRHALGVEALELLQRLARGHVHDRRPGYGLHGQRRTAPGVAIELCHHHPVERHGVGEGFGHACRVLTGHGIHDQQHVLGLGGRAHARQLIHHRLIHVQSPAGVDDQHVAALALGALPRPARDLHRVALGSLLVDLGARLRA